MSIKQAIEALEDAYDSIAKGYSPEKQVEAALAALRSMPEPVAWVRFCGDGLYEGPVMNCDKTRMENVRHKLSEWTPLCVANVPETNFGNTPHTESVRMSEAESRAAFERWCEAHLMPAESDWFRREPDEPDEYRNPMIDMAWAAWQARAVEQATAARLGVKMGGA